NETNIDGNTYRPRNVENDSPPIACTWHPSPYPLPQGEGAGTYRRHTLSRRRSFVRPRRPKPGGSTHAGGIAMQRRQEPRVDAIGEDEAAPEPRHILIKAGD